MKFMACYHSDEENKKCRYLAMVGKFVTMYETQPLLLAEHHSFGFLSLFILLTKRMRQLNPKAM